MRRLYLHIGLHKTGTSYLQRLLLQNRGLFADAGLGLGPYQNPVTGSHHPILDQLVRPGGPEAVFARAAAAPGDRLLISSEGLSHEIEEKPGYLQAVYAAAARHFEPHIVIFLRRQDMLKESVYAEAVKGWLQASIHEDDHYPYDHAARIARIEAVFGIDRVHVALYRDPGPNDILGDLLAATDTVIDRTGLKEVPPQNVSMHRRNSLFLGQMPKPKHAELDAQDRIAPHFISRVLATSPAIADDGVRYLLSPRERHDLVAGYLDGNRALVARRGIADARAFVALPDLDAPWTPPAPITAAEVAAVWRECRAACFRSRRNPFAAARMAARVAQLIRPVARRIARESASPAARGVEKSVRDRYEVVRPE